jgi:hypothetical protein
MKANYASRVIRVKLPPGRFLSVGEKIKPTDKFEMNGKLVKNYLIFTTVSCEKTFYRCFKYKPKYRYLKEGEFIKKGDQPFSVGCFTFKDWPRELPYPCRRKHVKVWVE